MSSSTIERGNAFRDLIASMLESAGFFAETEIRTEYKKADVLWRREDIDGSTRYYIEAKDYSSALGLTQCREFVADYDHLVTLGKVDRAWLISKGDLSADGRAYVDSRTNLKAMTFAEFQRRLLGLDAYLQELLAAYTQERISEWYVNPHTDDGSDLEQIIRNWVEEPDAHPIAIVAGYGKGKSTFARHLSANLAREALEDPRRRVPILVSLGDIIDEQSLEGLFGKVFTSHAGVRGYNFGLFSRLNQAGRFVVIFDGFDEMKHGMTLPRFEANILELMRLDCGKSKIVILGRDTAFQDDIEFRSIILGRQKTFSGYEVAAQGRRPFIQVGVRDFTLPEARSYVERFFPLAAQDALRGRPTALDDTWITSRTNELLSGQFDQLLIRPVHAQMLCQIATDPEITLTGLSTHGLFDRFVHFLIDREVRKRGRDARFSHYARRRFNAALAMWLWREGGISTVSLSNVPARICRDASEGVAHDYDDEALRKELTAGCLVEKSGGTIYFGHRSLQEFLVAEALISEWRDPSSSNVDIHDVFRLVTPEIASFVVDAVSSSTELLGTAERWIEAMAGVRRTDVPRPALRMLVEFASLQNVSIPAHDRDPWFAWLSYFVTNHALEFAPQGARAVDHLVVLTEQSRSTSLEHQAGVLLLATNALAATRTAHRFAPELFSAWLSPVYLRELTVSARKRGKGQFVIVRQDEDLGLWALLHSSSVKRSNGDARIVVDLNELTRRLLGVVRLGIVNETDKALEPRAASLEVPIQSIYRAWGLREAELERVRPFFSEEILDQKVKPLEVEIRGARPAGQGERAQTPNELGPQTSTANKRSTLSLRRPPPQR